MVDLPTPADVLGSTLVWLGVPALLLAPLMIMLWVADWLRALAATREVMANGSRRTLSIWNGLTGRRAFKLVAFTLSQATALAIVYAAFRLAAAMNVRDAAGRNIADGKSFTWQELWTNVTTYSSEHPVAVQAFWLTLGWLLAFNLAHLARSDILIGLVRLPATVLAPLCALAMLGIGVVGFMVWSLATWMESPGYNIGMVFLYAAWVAILGGGAIMMWVLPTQAVEIYRTA